jgi:prepilin-type N-terminal cleavage/methylation domain-containing protein
LGINNKKKLDFKSGFTLIELIVTIAILGIVLTMAYSMGAFANISFNNGSAKSHIQSNIRLMSNYITKEIRYSSDVTILKTMPDDEDIKPNKKYIYIDNEMLMQYANGKATKIFEDTSSNIVTTLKFEIQDSKTVNFNIQETLKNQTFQLGSTILLLNIGNHILVDGIKGAVVAYTIEPIITNVNTKPVETIIITSKEADPHNISINGGTLQLDSTVTPDGAIQEVYWTVDKSELATIGTGGLLKTLTVEEKKTIKVTATARDGSGVVSEHYEVTTLKPTVKFKFNCNGEEYETGESISIKHKESNEFTINVEPSGLGGTLTAIASEKGILSFTDNKYTIYVDKNKEECVVTVELKIGSETYKAKIKFQT